MNIIRSILLSTLVVLLTVPLASQAEDTDIYSGAGGTSVPNVLLVMDTGANFSGSANPGCAAYATGGAPSLGTNTNAGVEQCALVDAINSLPVGTVNIGLMVYNANNFTNGAAAGVGPCVGSDGGCLLKPLTLMDAAGKTALVNFIKTWKSSGSNSDTEFNVKTNNEKTGSAVQEAWAYYNGKIGMSGKNYATSIVGAGCQKNFMIFIGNSFNNSSGPGDPVPDPNNSTTGLTSTQVAATVAQKLKLSNTVKFPVATCGVNSLAAGTSASNWSENWADEWARYMYQSDASSTLDSSQNIITYTIGVIDPNSCKPDYPALLTNMATYGGGKYFQAGSASDVKNALLKILNEVQAVNSVFSSSSLPVSVNTQGTYLNQIYMGMFRPDASANPRWLGNLKQYQFIKDSSGNLKLGDASPTPQPAISSAGTGFISPNAISFWTTKNTVAPDSTGGFYVNDPKGVGLGFDSPDGEMVEKGGAAQQLRIKNLTDTYTSTSALTRNLYTYCPSGSGCNALLSDATNAFSTGNAALTASLLNTTSTLRDGLINWVRGEDNAGDEKSPGSGYTVRPSIHGDVMHSRPIVINYGGTTGVVVYYGANDGVFRAINGNQTSAIGAVAAGGEMWGLILPEFYSKLSRQRTNSPALQLSSTPSGITPTPQKKDYFVDGATGVYQKLNADRTTNSAYIYLTMRRGGPYIYALNVTDPTNPKVLWKKDTSDLPELGQTWSRPKIAVVKGNTNPILIFGAGYDTAEDSEPPVADTKGRGILVLDAVTGQLIWSATPTAPASCPSTATCATVSGMIYSIPSDVTTLDRDNDGKTDRLYVADVGGNVWRVDIDDALPGNWIVSKLAALGGSGTVPRKFFYPPSVVPIGTIGATTSYDAVLIGSGDREHPLYSTGTNSAYNVQNRFYMLKDLKTGKNGSGQATITDADLFNATVSTYDDSVKGFYINFLTGEKAVNAPLTVGGISYFGTNQPKSPSTTSCVSDLGIARGYSVSLFSGEHAATILDGGGLPPSPVAGIVTVDGTKKTFCIGCIQPVKPPVCDSNGNCTPCNPAIENCTPCKSGLDNCRVAPDGKKKIKRTYWYKE